MDDGLCAVDDYPFAVEANSLVRSTLDRVGFVVHLEKYNWKPTRRLDGFEFVIDLALGQAEVPQGKIESLLEVLSQKGPAKYV